MRRERGTGLWLGFEQTGPGRQPPMEQKEDTTLQAAKKGHCASTNCLHPYLHQFLSAPDPYSSALSCS